MESTTMGDDEEPTNSSDQEIDHDEDDHVRTKREARSYECMFCKRGFTTAQALGGHMNIHRKDRAKNRPSNYLSNNNNNNNNNKGSNKQDDDDHGCYTGPRFFQPVFASYPPTYLSASPSANHHHHQEGRQLHYFSSTSGDQRPRICESDHQVIANTSREEERRRISLQFGWSNGEDHEVLNTRDEEDELDLELRLGYDP